MTGWIRRALRRCAYGLWYWAGGFLVWRRRNKCVVMLYLHGVCDADTGGRWTPLRWQLNPRQLRRELAWLSKHFEFIEMDKAVRVLEGSDTAPVAQPLATMSIDDGYRNALTVALPIMEEFGIRPLVYVAPGPARNGERFWFDRLDYALQHAPVERLEITLAGRRYRCRGTSRDARRAYCREVIQASRRLFDDEEARLKTFEEWIQRLLGTTGMALEEATPGDPWTALASEQDIREAAAQGTEFGSHGMRGVRVGSMAPDAAREEIRESKAAIEELTGKYCRYFCFPEGDMTTAARNMVIDAGYVAGVSSEPGANEPGCDLFTLRRIHLPESVGRAELIARACGVVFRWPRLLDRRSGIRRPTQVDAAFESEKAVSGAHKVR